MDFFVGLVLSGITSGCLYALVALSIVLVYKATHVVSLAHGQIMTVLALFLWYCLGPWEIPVIVSLLLTFVMAILTGWTVNRFAMRPLIGQPSFSAFLMTFGIFIAISGFLQINLKGVTKGLPEFLPGWSFTIGGFNVTNIHIFSLSASAVVFGGVALLFKYSGIGLGMRATSENHQLAQGTGIKVNKLFALIWMWSSVVSAMAGIALAIVMDIQYELPFLGIKGLVVALFGGLESLGGALLAGILLGLLENLSAGYLDPFVGGGLKEVAAYLALLALLWFKPYGLFGLARIERI